MARIITITSGKGGVGKTSISLNLSLSLSAQGFKVCLFDADLGLANVSILTGIYPERDLESVITGQFSLEDVMIRDFMGIDIIPGSNGVEKIADLTRTQTGTLISAFLDLDDYDFFIFDTSAGISAQVISFCMASHEIILVATCEPTSLTDAYSMLKVLSKHKYQNPVRIVINQVTSAKAAQKAYNRLKQTAGRFLSVPIVPLGIVAADKNVKAAVISQTPFFNLFPDTVATRCINSMADRLLKRGNMVSGMPLELFWDKALRFMDTHYAAPKAAAPDEPDKAKPALSDDNRFLGEVRHQLAILDEKLTTLANDVAIIKELLKKKALNPPAVPRKQPPPDDADAVEPPDRKESPQPPKDDDSLKPVTLDFESWYKKRAQQG